MQDAHVSRAGKRWFRAVVAGAALAALAIPGSALADPPGNNGTVKIEGINIVHHPDNEPHVGCMFSVDFYGFDFGVGDATVTFKAHPPTGNGVLLVDMVDIGEDAAGGGTDLDAHVDYYLGGALDEYTPHPQQGFHVKLTVNAPGSIGADKKHKVFWVTDCELPS